jgi:hypothetical protein
MTMKVRANGVYTFKRSLFDVAMPQHFRGNLVPDGTQVRVIQLPGAPRPNTMGQAHIETLDGEFVGMVATASLTR